MDAAATVARETNCISQPQITVISFFLSFVCVFSVFEILVPVMVKLLKWCNMTKSENR